MKPLPPSRMLTKTGWYEMRMSWFSCYKAVRLSSPLSRISNFNHYADDQEEVAVVKRAILDHINMDPDRSLQVLCDQCVFELDGLDEEEKGLRSRLRTLVIVFLANDAKTMIERVVKAKELKADEILFKGLVNVRH